MATKHIDTVLHHAGTAPFNPETGTAPVPLPPMRASTVRFENLAALEKARETSQLLKSQFGGLSPNSNNSSASNPLLALLR